MIQQIEVFIQQWIADYKGLAVEKINLDDNVFEQGWLDSLAMFRLVLEIELEFDLTPNLGRLFTEAKPNIASLSKTLSNMVVQE